MPKGAKESPIWATTESEYPCKPLHPLKIESDLTFEIVQQVGLDAGLVDNKSAAIDDSWQALRFVYRLRDR